MAANPLSESAVQAIELDAFSKDIPSLIPFDKTLYSLFKQNATVIPVSNVTAAGGVTRPSFRVPMRLQAGAAINQGTGNADSLGRGTGSLFGAFALSPVFFFNTCEITFLARIATEGRKRGLFNVQAQELQNTYQQATQGLESLLQGDGSGTLDVIPSTAVINNGTGPAGPTFSSIVGMNNAFRFTDQQTVQDFSAVGGTNRGSFQISYVDPVSQTIYSSSALPTGIATGDYLIVNGASGAAGGSILGLQAWNLNSNAGTIGGLARSQYPGRLSTPTINLNGAAISLSTGYRACVLLGRALGKNNPAIKSSLWYTGPDQAFQIANLYFNTLYTNSADVSSDTTPDMVKKFWPQTYAGRPLHVGWDAQPGRLDLIATSTWYMGELLPLELYDFGGGITVAPVPDIVNGGYLTSSMFSYVAALQLANSNPRAALYVQNAAQPSI